MSSTRSFCERFSRTRAHHIQRNSFPVQPRTLLCLLCSLLAFLGLGAMGTVAYGQPLPPASVPPRTPVKPDAPPTDAPDIINGLRLQISSEEPTGVFFDRNTLRTRTAIVLSGS